MPSIGVDEILRVSGVPFSWASTRSKVNGVPFTGFLEIGWEESREGEYIHAQRGDGTPLGITSGLYKVDSFTFKTLIDTGEMICQQLAALGLGSYGNARWNYTVEIFEVGNPVITLNVSGIKIEKRKFSTAKGSEALAYEFEAKALGIQTIGAGVGLVGIPSLLANISAL